MTRNEARGILIRMQSEIENPYSTEAQALGIAIEKMERDYETEYWECQWKIDQLENSVAILGKSNKVWVEENTKREESCAGLLEKNRKLERELFEATCKLENEALEKRKDDERTSYRLDKLEAEMGDFAEKLWGLKKTLIRHIIDTEGVEIKTNPLDRDLR